MPTLQQIHDDPEAKRMLKLAAALDERANRPIIDGDSKLIMSALAILIRATIKRRRTDANVE